MTDQAKQDPVELELKLAHALGYVDVAVSKRSDQPLVGRLPNEQAREYLPRWARDNGAAYSLMLAQKLSVQYMGTVPGRGERRAAADESKVWAVVVTGDYGHDEEVAVRAAIAVGSIAKIDFESQPAATPSASQGPSLGR
jgi:hypothetical protein